MALPTSGKISIADIFKEMGKQPSKIGLNELAKLWYDKTKKAKFNNTKHNLSDWYGEKWINIALTVSPTRIIFQAYDDSAIINVISNTSWEVSTVQGSFVSVSIGPGNGNGSFYIHPETNNKRDDRSTFVNIKSINGNENVNITIYQYGQRQGP
ncbi:BACON domain-containing protein [Aquimarina sp. 2201CG1-2-11]|uniref:BACON domain-containing protein n=1 Tax=Aquimarina discodermiae TaxID=3231043 RepID=UPI0034638106